MTGNDRINAMSFDEKLAHLRSSKANGISIPEPEQQHRERWDIEKVAEIALRHPNIASWRRESIGSYFWAYRHNVLDDLTEHMERLRARSES